LIDRKYSKHYFKPYLDETRMDKDGYPYYRRRDNGKSFEHPGGRSLCNSVLSYFIDNF